MCIRKCPACKKSINTIDIIVPAFKGKGESIQCPHCKKIISKPWGNNLFWLPAFGFPVGYFLPNIIAERYDLGAYGSWLILALLIFVLLIIMSLLVPLSIQTDK